MSSLVMLVLLLLVVRLTLKLLRIVVVLLFEAWSIDNIWQAQTMT